MTAVLRAYEKFRVLGRVFVHPRWLIKDCRTRYGATHCRCGRYRLEWA